MTDGGERFPEEISPSQPGADPRTGPVTGAAPEPPRIPAPEWRPPQEAPPPTNPPHDTPYQYNPDQSPYYQQQAPPWSGYPPGYPHPGAGSPFTTDADTDTMVRPPVGIPRQSGRGGLLAAALVIAVVGGGIGGGVGEILGAQTHPAAGTPLRTFTTTVQAQPAAVAPVSVQQVAAKVLPSVVQIQEISGSQGGEGSGVVLSPDGMILTNNHVIEAAAGGAGQLTVTLKDGTSAQASIIGRDPSADIAVIKMANQTNLTPIALGRSATLAVGQDVVAVGSPLGLAGTVTTGIVSALNRPVNAGGAGSGQVSVLDAIQTDAAINPGNSGGALVNLNGQLVGINSAIASLGASSSNTQSGSIGLGFAIPIDQAQRIAQELITTGHATQAVLGVSVSSSTSPASPTAAAATGATITAVTLGGVADKAGITAGTVISKVDDQQIPDGDSLIAAIRSHPPGDTVTLTANNSGGASHTVQVTLDSTVIKAGN